MPQFQQPHDFLDDLIEKAQTAKRFIGLQAMVFEFGHAMDLVSPVLVEAAARGVDVQIHMDWVSSRYVDGTLDIFPNFDRKRAIYKLSAQKENRRVFDGLRAKGIKVTEMNIPLLIARFFPVYRRNHSKLYVVDDFVWMGGVNFFDDAFNYKDFMVRFDRSDIVQVLSDQFFRTDTKRREINTDIELPPDYTFVVDSGKNGKSLIYEKAIGILAEAKEKIVFVSQLVPEGKLLRTLLEKARAGVQVTILTSRERDSAFVKFPHNLSYQSFRKKIIGVKNLQFVHYPDKIHAKLIVVDDEVGVFGSHNFVDAGVLLGTEEIAMVTRDTELVRELNRFIEGFK
jgi:cardiolipin synthase A/B